MAGIGTGEGALVGEAPDGVGTEDGTGGGTRGEEGGGSEDSMDLSGPTLRYHNRQNFINSAHSSQRAFNGTAARSSVNPNATSTTK